MLPKLSDVIRPELGWINGSVKSDIASVASGNDSITTTSSMKSNKPSGVTEHDAVIGGLVKSTIDTMNEKYLSEETANLAEQFKTLPSTFAMRARAKENDLLARDLQQAKEECSARAEIDENSRSVLWKKTKTNMERESAVKLNDIIEQYKVDYEKVGKLIETEITETRKSCRKLKEKYCENSVRYCAAVETACNRDLLNRLKVSRKWKAAKEKQCAVSAHSVFLDMLKAKGSGKATRQAELHKELADMKVQPGETISGYNMRFRECVDSLIDLDYPLDQGVCIYYYKNGLLGDDTYYEIYKELNNTKQRREKLWNLEAIQEFVTDYYDNVIKPTLAARARARKQESSVATEARTAAVVVARNARPCVNIMRDRKCQYGNNCRFNHQPAEEQIMEFEEQNCTECESANSKGKKKAKYDNKMVVKAAVCTDNFRNNNPTKKVVRFVKNHENLVITTTSQIRTSDDNDCINEGNDPADGATAKKTLVVPCDSVGKIDCVIVENAEPRIVEVIERPGQYVQDTTGAIICDGDKKRDLYILQNDVIIVQDDVIIDLPTDEASTEFVENATSHTPVVSIVELPTEASEGECQPNKVDMQSAYVHELRDGVVIDDTGAGINSVEMVEMLQSNTEENQQNVLEQEETPVVQKQETPVNRRTRRLIFGVDKQACGRLKADCNQYCRYIILNRLCARSCSKTLFGAGVTEHSVCHEIINVTGKDTWKYILPADVVRRIRNGEHILSSPLFLKPKGDSFGAFEELKSKIVACGNFVKDNSRIENEAVTASMIVLMLMLEISVYRKV